MNLNQKQRAFIEEYLTDLNATQAAIRAGYSRRTAKAQGSRLLTNVAISSAIAEAKAQRSERTRVDGDRVIQWLNSLVFLDPTEIAEWDRDGLRLKSSEELSLHARLAISEIVEVEHAGGGKRLQVKLHDRLKAAELLGRHLSLWEPQLEQLHDLERRLQELEDQDGDS